MSTPESIVVSLEQAKALKKAGWPQDESNFYWEEWNDPTEQKGPFVVFHETEFIETHVVVTAPTAEEILRELPPSVQIDGITVYLSIFDDRDWVGDHSWDICYSPDHGWSSDVHVRDKDNFAGACAQMWCYLSENNLLKS